MVFNQYALHVARNLRCLIERLQYELQMAPSDMQQNGTLTSLLSMEDNLHRKDVEILKLNRAFFA